MMAFRLDDDLIARIKADAAERGQTLTVWFERAASGRLEERIGTGSPERVARATLERGLAQAERHPARSHQTTDG
jgi:hypothetical protein